MQRSLSIATSLPVSKEIQLKFKLTKNKYEIKHRKIITINEFFNIVLDKYEALEL
jgi:hypothetical protein